MERASNVFAEVQWEIPQDFLSHAHFLRVVSGLDMSSSPGYPYMRSSPTNSVLFGVDLDGNLDQAKTDVIWRVVELRIRERLEADPIRLFVKSEPHKLKKLEDGRYRLISSVSVVDQIIDHMLFDSMNELFVENWTRTPVKVGWAPTGSGWKAFPRSPRLALDKSSWDWTVRLWLCELVLALRVKLCLTRGDLFNKWLTLAIYRYEQLYKNPLFVTSGGFLLRQRESGVQKSGCVNTLADNSLQQWLLDCRVRLEHSLPFDEESMWIMGDDTSQEPVGDERYFDWLSEFCIVKEKHIAPEFCGFRFLHNGRIEPLYKGKHAYNLLHLNPKVAADVARSYTLLYHRSVHRDWMRALFAEMGLEIPPLWHNDAIFDGLE